MEYQQPGIAITLGMTLLHFSFWKDAEIMLKIVLDTQRLLHSHLYLQLHITLIESSGKWDLTVSSIEHLRQQLLLCYQLAQGVCGSAVGGR